MGGFVTDIQKRVGDTVKGKAVKALRDRQIVSKSIDIINQDSTFIKHDFDAGRSKLMKTHEMTQDAYERM